MSGAAVSMLLVSAANLIAPQLLRYAIDSGLARRQSQAVLLAAVGLTAVALGRGVFTFLQGVLTERASQGVAYDLREALFAQTQRLGFSYFDRGRTGQLLTRHTDDVETVRAFAGAGLFQLIAALVMLLGSALLLLFINWRLTLIAFATVPAVFVLLAGFARRVSQPFRQVQQMLERLNGSLQEALAGAREAQAFNRAEVNRARFRERNTSHRKANVQAVGITSAFAPAIDVLSTLATAIVTGYGGYLVFQNSLTVGQLAAFLIYVQQFFRPVQLISQG